MKDKMMSDGMLGYVSIAKNGLPGFEPLRSWYDIIRLKLKGDSVDVLATRPSEKAQDPPKPREIDLVWVCTLRIAAWHKEIS